MSNGDLDSWTAGRSYQAYMGRWSRLLADTFVHWLAAPRDADWIDVGCGTGSLTAAVLAECAPRSVLAIDPSGDFLAHARSALTDPRARFVTGDAGSLPAETGTIEVAASALVLNFLPDPLAGLREMQRVLRPDGLIGITVWDYPGGGVEFIDAFWKTAADIDPRAGELDEARRFGFCTRDGLVELCRAAGMRTVSVGTISIATEFATFEDFWTPFTLGAGPAPGYCKALPHNLRTELREKLEQRLGETLPIRMRARAWAVKGRPGAH